MKKLILIIIISLHASLFTVHPVTAQWGCACLPEGILFSTQAQIDYFQTYHPGCKKILGDVTIDPEWHNYITDLNGLNVLTSIGGSLLIRNTYDLTSMDGLQNLESINGDLFVFGNGDLASIAFNNLDSLGGNFEIIDNGNLTELTGFENLSFIGGNFEIIANFSLTDLTGFENLLFIGGNLTINDNNNLSNCTAEGICNYLVSPAGSVNIYDNATGCNNPPEIADNCGITLPCLPYGNYRFYSHSEIDNFQGDYPGCTTLEGDVYISGDIDNLFGLSPVTSISGDLTLSGFTPLESFTGLDNLTVIEGDLKIMETQNLSSLVGLGNLETIGGSLILCRNENLTNMQGLENLVNIGGDLDIGWGDYDCFSHLKSLAGLESLTVIGGSIEIVEVDSLTSLDALVALDSIKGDFNLQFNDLLEDLTGLENLEFVGGDLSIFLNDNLKNLDGLLNLNSVGANLSIDNNSSLENIFGLASIAPGTIENISITGNSSLSACNAESICSCLSDTAGTVTIYNNAPGCNGPIEVAGTCGLVLSCEDHGDFDLFSQVEIDYFPLVFPDCEVITGSVSIHGNDITNLDGLSNLVSIQGDLNIHSTYLVNLAGLENLNSVGGSLSIIDNNELANLEEFENLTSVAGDLSIEDNDSLTNISGLKNLTSVGSLSLIGNNFLSLSGLEDITTVRGSFILNGSAVFTLEDLSGLTCIGGKLDISYNNSLTYLEGLSNLALIGGSVVITYNGSSNRNISENNSSLFVKKTCPDLLEIHSGITVKDESIEEKTNVEILNNVGISGLECLFALNSISGHLYIQGNDGLLSLSGFENITEIGGDVIIQYNNSLVEIEGLHNLNSIGGQLLITSNDVLTDLTGLENLNSIGGMLKIYSNDNLSSLIGIDHVNAASISDLRILSNHSLASCAVQSICDYLALPDAVVYINNNAPGCDSEEEVEAACAGVGMDEPAVSGQRSAVSCYPNPTGGIVDFRFSTVDGRWSMVNGQWISLKVYDVHGREVATVVDGGWSGGQVVKGSGGQVVRWDASGMPAGVYVYRLRARGEGQEAVGKIVKY